MYDKTNPEESNNYHNHNSTFIKPRRRLKPLTIREYEADFREHASDQQLVERVFHGGIGDQQLRAALWPLILGLVNERGRFVRRTPSLTIRTATSTNGHSNGRSNGFGRNLTNGQSNNHNHRNHPTQYTPHNNNTNNNNNIINNRHYRHHGRLSTGLLSPGSDGRGLQRYQVATNGRRGLTLSSSSPAFSSSASDAASRRVAAAAAATVAAAAAAASTNKPGSYLGEYDFIDHEDNLRRWRELERQYRSYESQWRSIQPEQELRFSAFRDRKALIERDVIRSDRSHPFYADNSENLQALTTILMTYMMYDFDIGYLQGMSDIAAPILYVYQGDLVKTFWVFVEVMKLFRRNFETSQKTIHFQLNCLYRLVKLTDAKLARHLRQNECSNCFFVFRCIVCQFKRELMKQASSGQDCNKVTTSTSTETNHSIGENSGGLSDGLASSAASSSSVSSCSDSSESSSSSSSSSLSTSNDENDLVERVECNYNRVLNLWDTIWCVQKRHELVLKSKCVHTYTIANGRSSTRTPLADIQRRQQQQHQHQHQQCKSSPNSQPIKQKQIVYTRETFYSSFDPNQADVPRFELTETEKFVLSLCLSLIRRERNEILKNNMDASEIHQHFINPSLAEDFDTFVEQAYEVYEYLNTNCDLKLLVKGADELAGEAQTLDSSPSICVDEHLPSTADTYELLKDYLIISPTAYNISMTSLNNHNNRGNSGNSTTSNQPYRHNHYHHRDSQYQNGASLSLGNGTPPIRRNRASRYSVSQKSWDHFLNSDTLQ